MPLNFIPDKLFRFISKIQPEIKIRAASCAVLMVEIEELKLEVFRIISLLRNILPDHVPVPALSYGSREIPIGPQFSAPKFFPQFRVPSKQFSGRQTLYDLHQPSRGELWGSAHQIMDVILVNPNLLEFYAVTLFDFAAYIPETFLHVKTTKYRLPILHRCNQVIVDLISAMLTCLDIPQSLLILHKVDLAARCEVSNS